MNNNGDVFNSYDVIRQALEHSGELVAGERAQEYGDPLEAQDVIAEFWSTYLGTPITGEDVTLMMALLKIARLKSSPLHEDSMTDAIAYLAIGRGHQERSSKG